MSSMLRATTALIMLASLCGSVPAQSQDGPDRDGREWDHARARLATGQRTAMSQAIERWKLLSGSDRFGFSEYSSFVLTYPGFPLEEKMRTYAEKALERESPDPARMLAYFEKFPPLTNPARARRALAMASLRWPGAREAAIAAWRGGTMSDASEAALLYLYGASLTAEDHDARMDALLWAGASTQAERQISHVSPGARNVFMARLAMLQGSTPGSLGLPVTGEMHTDPGYVYNRARQARLSGNIADSAQLLVTRPRARKPPLDPGKWITELLSAAQEASAASAVRIAASIDDAFPPGTDVSTQSYRIRDDYTTLMWLGGTQALWTLGDGTTAAPLFYRYGAAAKTPGTRSKGFYWAGRALAKSGDTVGARRYFEMAAAYPDHYYGMLALERLGRPLPALNVTPPRIQTSEADRRRFMARPITAAVREVANGYDWPTTVRFFREIADRAESESDHVLVADLAKEIGRRDLAVILGQSAHSDGFGNFRDISFPLIPAPPGTDWTVVHAITRQESQFAQNAVSHAGASGLMQLMPGTAREQAGKTGLAYDPAALIGDAGYNLRLGDGYFGRMMDYYGGSFALAVGAYNAGPGNVNKWLRANGDPRNGGIDWVEWVERIPIHETRNYIQRVLENAVVYEAMNPARASYKGPNPLSHFLGKRNPG